MPDLLQFRKMQNYKQIVNNAGQYPIQEIKKIGLGKNVFHCHSKLE